MKKQALILSSICISLLAAPVYAYTDYEEGETERFLSAMEIMTGYEDGSFKPDNILTRSEAAKMIVTMYGGKSQAESTNKHSEGHEDLPYSDIDKTSPDWGYWYYLNEFGYIIDGFDDGTIRPNDTLTYAQFTKMLVSLTGYSPSAQSIGDYPTGYLTYGEKLGITDGIDLSGDNINKGVTRKDAATMAYAAMNVPVCLVSGYNALTKEVEYVICDGSNDVPYRTLLEVSRLYSAKVKVESTIEKGSKAAVLESKNLNEKSYDSADNYSIVLSDPDKELKIGETYTLLLENTRETTEDETPIYEIKYVYSE